MKSFLYKLLLIAVFSLTLSSHVQVANAASCTDSMTDAQCLEFLRTEAGKVAKAADKAQKSLSAEKIKQMNLTEQINYYNSQIAARESVIKQIEIELEAKNVEIRIISRDINDIQNNVDLIKQEINEFSESINSRIKLSYKYSFVSPVELALSANDAQEVLYKMKYVDMVRKQDYENIIILSEKNNELVAHQEQLLARENEIKEVRNSIEEEKKTLFAEKSELASERTEYSALMAESKKLEAEYNKEIKALEAEKNSYDQQITAMIMRMYNEGNLQNGTPVAKGQIIGFQGHTGCSYGSHLHFGIASTSNNRFVGDIDPFATGHLVRSGGYARAGTASAPMDNAYITQGFHSGKYIDLVSLTAGNQSHTTYGSCWVSPTENQCYYVPAGTRLCGRNTTSGRWYPLRGEGAPVYAIYEGTVYYGVDSWGGAKYAMVVHPNGFISMYVHLR